MENYNRVPQDESSRIGEPDDFTSTFPFIKALMTGLFIGIADTLICLLYNLFYRDGGPGFFSSDIVNVSSIIFGTNILFLVIGVLFFAFSRGAMKGEVVFSILFLVLTIIGAIAASHVHRSVDPAMNARFHGLLEGVVLIIGISAAVGMPLLYHSRKFGQYVL
jgi:hypothetical protein